MATDPCVPHTETGASITNTGTSSTISTVTVDGRLKHPGSLSAETEYSPATGAVNDHVGPVDIAPFGPVHA